MHDARPSFVPQRAQRRWPVAVLVGLSLPLVAWVALMPPLPQDPAYHDFADQRAFFGVPHFWNVVSNLPFAAVGLLGCWWLVRASGRSRAFVEPRERVAYFAFFLGEFLTCFGSAYYHSAPSNPTLVWDRLALSLMLTSLFSIVVAEFVSVRVGRVLLVPMLVLGLFSVLYWGWGESAGRGDLRFYILVQFYPLLAIPLIILLFPSRYSHGGALLAAWVLYAAAKGCEHYDWQIQALTGFWSGHTFKHLVAAGASYVPLHALRRRSPHEAPR